MNSVLQYDSCVLFIKLNVFYVLNTDPSAFIYFCIAADKTHNFFNVYSGDYHD